MNAGRSGELPEGIAEALHPLDAKLPQAPWNLVEIADLPEAAVPRHQAAVMVPLLRRPQGWQVLLTVRTASLSRHPGQIAFPGGRIDPGDAHVVAAALREAEEEIGLAPAQVDPLGLLDPYATVTGFRIVPVVARLDPGFVPRPDPREVEEAFEVPLEFLSDPGSCETVRGEWRGRVRHYFQFRYGGHRIWGATAAILVNLRERMNRP